MVNATSLALGSASPPEYMDPVVHLRRHHADDLQQGSSHDVEMHYALPRAQHSLQQQSGEAQQEYLRYRNELLASLWAAQQQQHASATALQTMYTQQPNLLPPYSRPNESAASRTAAPQWAQIPTTLPREQAQQAPQPLNVQRRPEPHHRVYSLRCSHCDSFLSDRGMRAVLLLKPHITLFSTDVAPVNCGPLYGSHDEEPECAEEKVERTCECLTQSLGCYSCGNTVGCKSSG